MAPELADFTGGWRLSRQIVPATGAPARFIGTAEFTPRPDGRLAYRETGQLMLPDAPAMQAERGYLWAAEGGGIAVFFADGRPFHRFTPARPEARHWCAPDDYSVRYDFSAWPEWHSHWQVRGPRKDYTMFSQYSRAGQGPARL